MRRDPGQPVKIHGPSYKQDGCTINSNSSTPHLMGRGPDLFVKTRGPPHGQGGAAHMSLHLMGRGRARPIKFRNDVPRPGSTHQFFRRCTVIRPGPSNFWMLGRDQARSITFSSFHGPARPGPKISISRAITLSKYSARPGPSQLSDGPGPARTTGPWQALINTKNTLHFDPKINVFKFSWRCSMRHRENRGIKPGHPLFVPRGFVSPSPNIAPMPTYAC